MPERKKNRITALCAVLLALTLTVLSAADYFAAAGRVRNDVLRLHILANSDGEADQAVKLLVRDRLLAETADLFRKAGSPAEAAAALEPLLPALAETAAAVLRENGMDYGAAAALSREYFNTRTYGDVTLPAGSYLALRVILGEGQGHNWWCVMFPPLCIPAVTEPPAEAVFSPDGLRVVSPAPRFQVRFRLVEIYEEIMEQIKERKNGKR